MSTITIRKRIDSETLHIPELKPMIGKEIEITFRDQEPEQQPEVDRFAILEKIAQMDLIDPELYRQYDEAQWKFVRESVQ